MSSQRSHPNTLHFGLLAAYTVGMVTGCATYQPKPATEESLSAAIEPMPSDELARAVALLRHPMLPPVLISEDGSLNPNAAAVVAVLQSPSLRAARDRRGVAAAQLLQAGILPNPQLSASVDFPVAGATDGTINAFGIGANWDITALIGREAARSAASHEAESVNLDIAWQEWQAAMGAKLHATRVLWLSLQCNELARQVEVAEHAETAATASVQAGLATMIEREAAATLVQKRRAARLSVESSLVSESALLRQALGLPPQAIVRVVAEPGEPCLPSPADVDRRIELSRLDLAALRAGYASQEEKLRGAVLSQFPKIGLGITRARDTSNVGTLGLGITLDLPIFDRGQGRIAIEHATRQMLFDELAARTFDARSDAARALAELTAMRPQVEQGHRTAARLKTLAERLGEACSRGDADIVQLAQAQNDAADGAIEHLRLQQQEAELRIALEVATGQLIGAQQP